MHPTISDLIREWNGEAVVSRFDEETDSWFFVAMHDATLGPPVGGCRMKRYPRPADGLLDAMRLAEGMTYKWAGVGFPFGGGKSVLALSRELESAERPALLRRFGRLLRVLNGAFMTGVDLGTTPEDMAVIAEEAPYVMGVFPGRTRDPGPYTALGVFEGMRVAARHALGAEDLTGLSVVIQGLGDVGEPLARQLAEAGARLTLSDLNEEKARALAAELGAALVTPEAALETECDILAPCAVGAVLGPASIPRLRCRVVAGSANNQLDSASDAGLLHERGILYAPDYIVNAGGAIAFGLMYRGVEEDAELRNAVCQIGGALEKIFAESERDGESPATAARRRAERVLERARTGSGAAATEAMGGSPAP
ncbi:MAG: Glu/Leu/Phe/Val dehydrogenase dimerization domain-containing protein [Gemmatimonadota bacterium]